MNDNIIKCRIEHFFYKNTKSLHYAIVFSIKTQVFLKRSKNPSRVLVFEFCLFYKEHHYHLSSRLLFNPLESCRQRWHRISELLHKKQSSQYGNLKLAVYPKETKRLKWRPSELEPWWQVQWWAQASGGTKFLVL